MITLATVLLILSAICFALGAAGVESRIDWTNAGFTFIVLWLIVGWNRNEAQGSKGLDTP